MAALPPPGAYTGWTYGQYQPSPQVTVPLQSPWTTQPVHSQQPQQGQGSGFSSTAWRPPNLPSPATGNGNEGWGTGTGTGTNWDTQHRNDNGGGWTNNNSNNNRAAATWDSGANPTNVWGTPANNSNNNDGGGWGNDNNNGWGNSANDNGWNNSGNDNGWDNSGNDNGWENTANDGGWGNSSSNGGWGSGERHNNSVRNADDAGNGADWFDTANGRGRERQRQPSRGRPREREGERGRGRDWGNDVRERLNDWMDSGARRTQDHWEENWDGDQDEDDEWERVEREEEERGRWNLTPAPREQEPERDLYQQFDRMHLRDRDPPPQTRKHKSKSKSKSRHRDRERTRTHSLPSHSSPYAPAHLPYSASMPSPYAAYQQSPSPYTPSPYTPAYTPVNLGYAQYAHPGPRQEDVPFRPRTWRADYTIKPSSSPLRFLRRSSDIYSDTIKRSLHPSLQVGGGLDLDLRVWNAAALEVGFGGGGAGVASVVLNQHATSPPTSHMRLVHPRVPWYIDILPSPSSTSSTSHSYTDPYAYVKVFDVIVGVYHSLTTGPISQVRAEEYWAGEMGAHVPIPSSSLSRTRTTGIWKKTAREQVSHSWRVRGQLYGAGTEGEGRELARGVRRVDWLAVGASMGSGTPGGEFRWIGLKKARKGVWEVVTEV